MVFSIIFITRLIHVDFRKVWKTDIEDEVSIYHSMDDNHYFCGVLRALK